MFKLQFYVFSVNIVSQAPITFPCVILIKNVRQPFTSVSIVNCIYYVVNLNFRENPLQFVFREAILQLNALIEFNKFCTGFRARSQSQAGCMNVSTT